MALKPQFMMIDLSISRYLAENELESVVFIIGGVITVGIALAYWCYLLFKDRDKWL